MLLFVIVVNESVFSEVLINMVASNERSQGFCLEWDIEICKSDFFFFLEVVKLGIRYGDLYFFVQRWCLLVFELW